MSDQRLCQTCGAPIDPSARFCGDCGAEQVAQPAQPPSAEATPRCPACGREASAGATFCLACGASLTGGAGQAATPKQAASTRPAGTAGRGWRIALWVGGGVAALVAILVVVLLVSGDGEGGDGGVAVPPLGFPDTDVEIDEALVGQLEEAIADLPKPIGDNDRDQIRSMIGLPDTFTISFERSGEEGDGPLVRYETWFYYELITAYEFADGALISNMPIEPVEGLIFLPKKYDPAAFERTTTWDEITPMLSDPDSFEARELEEEYEVPVVYYAGEQLLVAFDDEGLFYVETVPLGEDES